MSRCFGPSSLRLGPGQPWHLAEDDVLVLFPRKNAVFIVTILWVHEDSGCLFRQVSAFAAKLVLALKVTRSFTSIKHNSLA